MTNANQRGSVHNFTAHAAEQACRLSHLLHDKIESAGQQADADAVHQLRISLRRYTQATRMAIGGNRAASSCWEEMLACSGKVRDRDIAIARLQSAPHRSVHHADADHAGAPVPWMEVLMEVLAAQREFFAGQLRTQIGTFLVNQEPAETISRVCDAQGNAGARLLTLADNYLRRGNEAALQGSTARQLHRFRLVAKRLRYSLELFQTFYPRCLSEMIAELRGIQACLGHANDCRMIRHLVRDISLRNSRDDDAPSHALAKHLKREQKHRIQQFRAHWKETIRPTRQQRAWLETLNRLFEPGRNG